MTNFMATTFVQVLEMTLERGQRLDNEIKQLTNDVRDASEVRRNADLLFVENENPQNLWALNEAEDKYWDLQDKLDELIIEQDNLRAMIGLFRNIPDCKDIGDLANALISI